MSCVTQHTIECDGVLESGERCEAHYDFWYPTEREAYVEAFRDGWSVRFVNGRPPDLCPDCVAEDRPGQTDA